MEIQFSQKAEMFEKHNIDIISEKLLYNSKSSNSNTNDSFALKENVEKVIQSALEDFETRAEKASVVTKEVKLKVINVKTDKCKGNTNKITEGKNDEVKTKTIKVKKGTVLNDNDSKIVSLEQSINVLLENLDSKNVENTKEKQNSDFESILLKDENQNRKNANKIQNNSECFKNRYEAQKDIILMQKLKLLEKEQEIEELKFGKASEKLTKSVQGARHDLKVLTKHLSNNANKLIVKMLEPESPRQVEMRINKVPKMVRQMEMRAKEREEKRMIIQERKRLIEEEKKRLNEELVLKKQAQDEEERKKNLQMMKERRRKELEWEAKRREEKRVFVEKCKHAQNYFERKLKKRTFKCLLLYLEQRRNVDYISLLYFETKILKKSFQYWKCFNERVQSEKKSFALRHYNNSLKRKALVGFKILILKKQQNLHVAIDYYNFTVQAKVFTKYYLIVNAIKTKRCRQFHSAIRHYNTRLLVQYFYQWKSLPAVLQLERAKEEKKRKWREKVLEVIPDYRPPEIF